MEFDNSFIVPLPPPRAWAVLMDIERIAPCVPGAQLTEKLDERAYKGKVGIKLGPVALSFAGTARFEDVDEAAYSARVKANGNDSKGRGGANSTASFRIEPVAEGSKVLVHTNLILSGSVAQYGRGVGMIQEVSAELIRQFSANLRQMIASEAEAAPAETPHAAATSVPAGTPDTAIPSMPQPTASAAVTPRAAAQQPALPATKPISGVAFGLRVLWRMILRTFGLGARTR